jgi:protein SERAC1
VPLDFDKKRLSDVLRHHEALQCPKDVAANNADNDSGGNGVWVHTLAPDLQFSDQVATIRFRNLPTQLGTLERNGQLTIDINVSPKSTRASVSQKRDSVETVRLAIDQHFNGITTLFSPSVAEHQIDILAISGLGSHAFGSFEHKGDGHVWLSDNLPRDMPTARVMIYGYESGLQHSTSLTNLDDLASSLQITLFRVLKSGKNKHLILVGHSLGGLLIKEALIQMVESDSESDLIGLVSGFLLFGVPNDGMDIESLIPIVNNQPNRFLLELLNAMNPQIMRLQKRNFGKVLGKTNFEMFCFYETRLSPTAIKVRIY